MDTTDVYDRLVHGIVLAAGDGRRLQLYVQEIRGEGLPKQYVNVIGRRSIETLQAAKQDPSRIVLLAIEPDRPETEYGYVVPYEDVGGFCRFGTRRVAEFIEKPRTELATELMRAGGLWNTMTMVFKADALLQLIRTLYPGLYFNFCRILESLGTRTEAKQVTGEVLHVDGGSHVGKW